jgi:rhodanese-related sulfurtransferase
VGHDNEFLISSLELQELINSSQQLLLVDVRTEAEYGGQLGHLHGAVLRPIQNIGEWKDEFEWEEYDKVIMICRSGNRSGTATNILRSEGFTNVYNLVGGMKNWNKQKLPVVKSAGEMENGQ